MPLILSKEVLEMCGNKEKPSVSEDFRQKSSTSDVKSSTSDAIFGKNFASGLSF